MGRESEVEKMSVFEQIREGLKEGIAHARGELTLRTTMLPAPAPKLSRARVVRIRTKSGMSQAVFARVLNVPTKTLQSWEQGTRSPKAGEARLLEVVEAGPQDFLDLLSKAQAVKRGRVRRG